MHGARGSRAGARRYQCSTRRRHGDCTQAIVKAEPVEAQLVAWPHAFQSDAKLRDLVLDTIRAYPAEPQRRSGAPPRTTDQAGPTARPLRPRRPHQAPLHYAPPSPRGRTTGSRAACRPELDRAQELLGDFWHAALGRATQAPTLAVRAGTGKDNRIVAVKTQHGVRQLLHRRVGGAEPAPKKPRQR